MMINYQCCTNIGMDGIYTAFREGFSDYIIKMEMPQDLFISRFFGPEGNSLEHSFIALDGEKPVGLILGGIRVFDGVKTLRCGALCVHPDYRGQGVSQELFRLHMQTAIDNSCKQLFLEVIVGNDRAIKFYNKLGYEKIYDIRYYSHAHPASLAEREGTWPEIGKVDLTAIGGLSPTLSDLHINWQNTLEYVEMLDGISYYAAYHGSDLVGGLVMSGAGKIFLVWTAPEYRHRGIASSLIKQAVDDLQSRRLSISTPNNASLEGFLRHLRFEKDSIAQYEMYLTL